MEFELPIFLTTIFISVLIFLFLSIQQYRRSYNPNKTRPKLPPGPWKLPLIGSIHHLIGGGLPHRCLRGLAKRYGPLIHLQIGEVSTIIVSSPQAAKEVLKTHDIALANRPELLTTAILFYNSTDITFSPYGNYWRQMRKICTIELLSGKMVRSFRSIRQDQASSLLETIRESGGKPINFTELLLKFTSSVVCRAAFGKTGRGQDTLIAIMKEAVALAGGFGLSDLFPSMRWLQFVSGIKPRLLKMHQKVDRIFDDIIREHQENKKSDDEDLIDVLLRIKESGDDLEFPITMDNIKAVIFDMFAAGTETSSTTIEWAMSEMMRNPSVMEKAQAELREVFKEKTKIDEVDVQKLKYIKLVIKETLRMHPPIPLLVPRECREQCNINGYDIPIKTKIMVNAWAIGRDPEYWPKADKFMPERFEESSLDFTGTNYEYIPFGSGRRMCPGMTFGLANVELPLVQLLYHFNWKLPGGIKPEELDLTETAGITCGRKNSLHLIATPSTCPDDI